MSIYFQRFVLTLQNLNTANHNDIPTYSFVVWIPN